MYLYPSTTCGAAHIPNARFVCSNGDHGSGQRPIEHRALGWTRAPVGGVIWANTYNKFDPTSPFGGYKESGYGREGGVHGLSAYLSLN